jgi:hypothetical protein
MVGNGGKLPSAIHLAGGAANAALMLATAGSANAYASQDSIAHKRHQPRPHARTDRLQEGVAADTPLQGIEAEDGHQTCRGRNTHGTHGRSREEMARRGFVLASDAASYVTGINMSMDGATTPLIVR